MKLTKKQEIVHVLMLVLTALLWGSTFAAQSIGAEKIGAFGYVAAKSWIAVILLLPTAVILGKMKERSTGLTVNPRSRNDIKKMAVGGILCGLFLFSASCAQQAGIAYTTTAKSGFITTMYIVIVPVVLTVKNRVFQWKIWVCVAIAVIGLYLLSFSGVENINAGDTLTLLCAVLFSCQIIMIDRFVDKVDPIWLSFFQFATTAVLATICSFIFENNTWNMLIVAAPALLFAGVFSCFVAHTLQIVAQKGMNPTVASLVMSLESVFGALSGWVVLGQTLTIKEFVGCVFMFAAIVLSQIPLPEKKRKEEVVQ